MIYTFMDLKVKLLMTANGCAWKKKKDGLMNGQRDGKILLKQIQQNVDCRIQVVSVNVQYFQLLPVFKNFHNKILGEKSIRSFNSSAYKLALLVRLSNYQWPLISPGSYLSGISDIVKHFPLWNPSFLPSLPFILPNGRWTLGFRTEPGSTRFPTENSFPVS